MKRTVEHIRKLFPEAEQISDIDLRQKVYKAWLAVWEMSDSDPPEKIRFLPGVLPEINNVEHTKAVVAMSIQYAKLLQEFLHIQLNMDYIIAGAILHDLGKCFTSSPAPKTEGQLLGHALSGAYVAIKEGLPLDVVHIIAAHSVEGDLLKRTPEAAIVHYMDFAYAEVALRAKTPMTLNEWMKTRDLKKLLSDEGKK
jgi:putative nucleotidyltransferase with HDIG domain